MTEASPSVREIVEEAGVEWGNGFSPYQDGKMSRGSAWYCEFPVLVERIFTILSAQEAKRFVVGCFLRGLPSYWYDAAHHYHDGEIIGWLQWMHGGESQGDSTSDHRPPWLPRKP